MIPHRDMLDGPPPKVMQVIEVHTLRGSGKSDEDPMRVVRRYYALDGRFLAEFDHVSEDDQFFSSEARHLENKP
jgi:hypothetical protein